VSIIPDYDEYMKNKIDDYPEIYFMGSKNELLFTDFLVIFKGKIVKCSTALEAVDIAFKSFYLFKIEFPKSCYGA
jgi:hypothetical protein